MDLSVRIVLDDDVFALIEDASFIEAWSSLAAADQKATLIQEHAFVSTWYKTYAGKFSPVLCLAYTDGDELAGLMPLARNKACNSLVHAGANQAEYHGWIARPGADHNFIVSSLIELQKNFDFKRWAWRWLPPGTPSDWLSASELTDAGIHILHREQMSPVLDLKDEDKLRKVTRSSSIKSKINRFKKRGQYHFERIDNTAAARDLMGTLAMQCDFRQGAINDSTPFMSDENKSDFFINRMNHPHANHFSVLWLNDNPIAFHIGACDRERVLLGLSSYDPIEGSNSPGTVLMAELITMLASEGYRYFDLTPGGDAYKERYASGHERLYMPTLVTTAKAKTVLAARNGLREALKSGLQKFNVNENAVKQVRHLASNPTSLANAGTLSALMDKPTFSIKDIAGLHQLDPACRHPQPSHCDEVASQRYADLLKHSEHSNTRDRNLFLLQSLRRFEAGDKFYSIIRDNKLAQYIWLKSTACDKKASKSGLFDCLPDNSVILYDAFTRSGHEHQLPIQNLIEHVLSDHRLDDASIYALPLVGQSEFNTALHTIGFRPRTKLGKESFG